MNYGLLRVDGDGNVRRVLIVDVADDRTALACARDFADDRAVEIWRGSQQVAALEKMAGRTAGLGLGS